MSFSDKVASLKRNVASVQGRPLPMAPDSALTASRSVQSLNTPPSNNDPNGTGMDKMSTLQVLGLIILIIIKIFNIFIK